MRKVGGKRSKGRMLAQVWQAFRQLNPKNVDEESRRTIRVGMVGDINLLQDSAAHLLGEDLQAYDEAGDTLILLTTPLEQAAFSLLPRCDALLLSFDYTDTLPGVATERIFRFSSTDDLGPAVRAILREPELSYLHLPFARALPAFRRDVASEIIQGVSIENAVFTASTSLGNIIPNPLQPLASVAESLGDLVVLTANQMRMLFRLAAAYDQDMGYKQQVPEVLTILAAAFGWRSLARELVSKAPFGAGIVPKSAIAFAGTWAIGDGIVYYYTTGKRLTKQEMAEHFEAAYDRGKEAAEVIVCKLKEVYAKRTSGKENPLPGSGSGGSEAPS